MKGYLVDTNLPSELTKPAPDPRVAAFLIGAGRESVYASVVTIGEIAKGIVGLPEGKRRGDLRIWLDQVMRPWFAGRILPVTENIAELWGTLTAEQRQQGRQITMADGLIAATALEHGLTLATRNVRDFEGLGVTHHQSVGSCVNRSIVRLGELLLVKNRRLWMLSLGRKPSNSDQVLSGR